MQSEFSYELIKKSNFSGIWAIYRQGDEMSSVPVSLETSFLTLCPASRLLALSSPLVTVQSPYRSDIHGFTPCVFFEASDEDMYFACDRMHGDVMGAICGLAAWQDVSSFGHAGPMPEPIELLAQEFLFLDAVRSMQERKNGISPGKWTCARMPLLKAEAAKRDLPVCDETTLCCDLSRHEQLSHWNYSYSYGTEQPISDRLRQVIESFDPMLRKSESPETGEP